ELSARWHLGTHQRPGQWHSLQGLLRAVRQILWAVALSAGQPACAPGTLCPVLADSRRNGLALSQKHTPPADGYIGRPRLHMDRRLCLVLEQDLERPLSQKETHLTAQVTTSGARKNLLANRRKLAIFVRRSKLLITKVPAEKCPCVP